MPEQRNQNRNEVIPQGERSFRALRYRGAANRVEFAAYGLGLFLIVAGIFTIASALGFGATAYSCAMKNSQLSATPTYSCNYPLMAAFVVVALIFLGVICCKMTMGRSGNCRTSGESETDW